MFKPGLRLLEPVLAQRDPTPPGSETDAKPSLVDAQSASPLFGTGPVDMERLQTDPTYHRAYEDWLDLQENLARSPRDTRRLDLIFVISCLLLTALLIAAIVWLFR